jgi:putative ABC transport system permease protein
MPLLARRNLFHDKVRLAVTLTGIVFAVCLIVVELALFFGFLKTTSRIIDNSNADLWVASKHVPYLEAGVPFSEYKLYQVKAVPGVAEAEKLIIQATRLSRPDGVQEVLQLVGCNPAGRMGCPWNIVQGNLRGLRTSEGIILDEFNKKQMGVTSLGETVEINGHRARVVGFTRGIHSFAPSPYIFTSFENAVNFANMREDQTTYILVKLEPGANVEKVRQNILSHVKEVTVLTSPEFGHLTQHYWTFTTGAGIALLLAAALGMIVGFVVVAQTIYATTMDHIREFGTLKAMGAPNSYVYKVILTQAAISALIGYSVGIIISGIVLRLAAPLGAPVLMNWWLGVATFLLTLLMCAGAAMVSINKVTHLDPAMVFKG